jgi:Ca2+/Na+ antiporter
MQRFSREGNSSYAHFLTLVWFLWMKFVSLGILLIVLLLSVYVYTAFNFRNTAEVNSFIMLHKNGKPFCWNTPMLRVTCRRKENSTQETTASEATLAG